MAAMRISAGMIFQCVFEGSLSMRDTEIERRPYHKNCNCALHRSKGNACSNACPQQGNISFPNKQSWAENSICIAKTSSKLSNQHSFQLTHSRPLQKEMPRMRLIACHAGNR